MTFRSVASVVAAALAATFAVAAPAHAWTVTWLGHAGVVVQAKDGTTVLIDPWLENPKFPKGYQLPAHVDAILVTHGHFDHAGSAAALAAKYKAPIVGSFELVSQLQPKGSAEGMGGNAGGTVKIKGLTISMIPAVHSSSLGGGDNEPPHYAGAPLGFVLQAAGERTLMHGGDTGLTRDYEAVKDAFAPKIALLPIGGHFTLDPRQAAIAARYLGATDVVPIHWGTFPMLTGNPGQLRQVLKGAKVQELTPGKPTKL